LRKSFPIFGSSAGQHRAGSNAQDADCRHSSGSKGRLEATMMSRFSTGLRPALAVLEASAEHCGRSRLTDVIQRKAVFFKQTGDPIQTVSAGRCRTGDLSGGERGITRRGAPRPFGAALRALSPLRRPTISGRKAIRL
jgi:hypothetical protein